MEDKLKDFLFKFAELERRVRKLALEDRALREEVRSLRTELEQARRETDEVRQALVEDRELRESASRRVAALIKWLGEARSGGSPGRTQEAAARGRRL